MKYSDFIKTDENFQYSINLQYDLNKLNKIDSYIPTKMALELLNSYLKSIYYSSKERATVLVGPYGKGKSHLLLILISIISSYSSNVDNTADLYKIEEVLKKLFLKIKSISEETYQLIYEIRKDDRKILPIIINGNYLDLNQSFLIALKEALEKEDLIDLIPNTYFDSVIKDIENWKEVYPETHKVFENKLNSYNITLKEFTNKIKKYDKKMYDIFTNIYEEVTSGGKFNPLSNTDVVKLYNEINTKICSEKNYKGMFIVFDEFSKFLEGCTIRDSSKDMKVLQDFAELANRSGENQIHLCCITHKPLNDYIFNLPRKKIEAWRAVEGRFKEILFTASSSQNYELIGNAIKKNEKTFNEFIETNEEKFFELLNICSRLGLFQDINNYIEFIGKKCFPLNPVVTYALPRISEKVAQNERTLFTFLSKNEKGSLGRFISQIEENELSFLNLDWLYDYFQILFKKEVFNENVHLIWIKTNAALKKAKDQVEKKIIKAISLIYIINEPDKIAPTDSVIQAALAMDREEYLSGINSLLNRHIIIRKKSNNFYNFLPGSSLNISKSIQDIKEAKIKNINSREVLSEIIDLGYEIPKRYNDNYEMMRFFKKVFITVNELEAFGTSNDIFDYYKSDGVIFYIIYEKEEDKKIAIEKLKQLNSKRILLCISNNCFSKVEELKDYRAIQYLKSDNDFINCDDYAIQELELYETDIIDDLNNYIKNNYDIQFENCNYYDKNQLIVEIKKNADISKKLSYICKNCFELTPIINNEMINKMKISSQILKARNKIINYIFEELNTENDNGIEGNGPEATIFRATIKNKGLCHGKRLSNDNNLNTVLSKIDDFILSCEDNKICTKNVYDNLYNEKYGLRNGIIPIYFSFVLKNYKQDAVIYFTDKGKDKEVPLSVEVINRINSTPEKYYLYIEKGTNEKREYLNNLDKLFSKFKCTKEIGYNMFNSIVDSMQKWIQSLPKYTREFEIIFCEDGSRSIDLNIKELRKSLLKLEINPRDFLFSEIKEIFNEENYQIIFHNLKLIKELMDNHIYNLKNLIIEKTKHIFDRNYKGELSTVLYEWHNNLDEISKKHLYGSTANSFIGFISNSNTYDDNVVIEKICKIITGLNIEDWNDETFNVYLDRLENIKEEIETYTNELSLDEEDYYEIKFYSNGEEKNRTFKSEEISTAAKALFNELEDMFDEYGDSINENEKRNVLIKLMKKFM